MSRCPICSAPVAADVRFKPFCSEHCRLVDLGRWFGGDYRVAGAPLEQTEQAAPGDGTAGGSEDVAAALADESDDDRG
jgi:hypothetical protein